MIHAIVRTLAGTLLELNLDANQRVSDLKAAIGDEWRIPIVCQELVHGFFVLGNSQYLSDYCFGGSMLSLTLVVSVERVCIDLSSAAPLRQMHALGILVSLGARGGDFALNMVREHLHDAHWRTRRAAVDAFVTLAKRGRHMVVASLVECSTDAHWVVRRAAVGGLARKAEQGNEEAVVALIARLRDEDMEVQQAALEALEAVAHRGDQRVIQAVCALFEESGLGDPRAAQRIRLAALDTLTKVVQPGDKAVDTLISRMTDCDPQLESTILALLVELKEQVGYCE
mmetsp:Transcript_41468/g.77195  ORF Transcript_41468/g.77195 Transcript_41468/m.77195 type:complete len:285 (+) Transcript_41468:144-998(+)